MDIKLPEYHKCYNFKESTEAGACQYQMYLRSWEIGVPLQDSLEWSILMSHLTSANFSKPDGFKERLTTLTNGHEDLLEIKNCISSYNPFLNRYACFHNKCLLKAFDVFKRKLCENQVEIGNDNYTSKLDIACHLLNCSIFLVTIEDGNESEVLDVFPKEDSVSESLETRMTLYYRKSSDSMRFHFGMKKDKGDERKRAAIIKILKQANIQKQRRKSLLSLNPDGESFLISVLKSEFRNSIPILYKSSYHAWKLQEAGLEMDPRVVGCNGVSALYHALVSGDEKLLYILHNYAANACHDSEKNIRDPDGYILENLETLGYIIARDRMQSNDFEEFHETAEAIGISANQLKRFNEFLIQMCKSIVEEKEASTGSVTQEFYDTTVRKNVMLALLNTYSSFFFYNESEVSNLLQLDNYSKYDSYYRNLDYSASLFFFDNIFYLKERLLLENNGYSELESNFFFNVLTYKYFSSEIKANVFTNKNSVYQKHFNNYVENILRSPKRLKYFKFIPLLERLNLRQTICNFIETLKSVEISKAVVIKCIPEDEVTKSLKSLPEVKDELMICRLVYYVQIALSKNVESIKQSLVIERALQVLGEVLVYGSQNRTSLCFFLFACIPEEKFRMLKQIRNILSHLNLYAFTPKLKAEKNYFLFHSIQKELQEIFESFQGILEIQQLRLSEYIFMRGLEEIKKNIAVPGNRGIFLLSEELKEALSHLEEEYKQVKEIKSISCHHNTVFKNNNILENFVRTTEEMLKDNTFWNEESVLEKINEILWPLKYLLSLISKDCKDLNCKVKETIGVLEEISVTALDTKDKMDIFWKKYKDFVSELPKISDSQQEERDVLSNIEKFKRILKGHGHISEKEKQEIRSQIPESVMHSIGLKREIQESLESNVALNLEQISEFPQLFLSNKNLKRLKSAYEKDLIKSLEIIKTADDPVADLESILDGSCTSMGKDTFIKLCKRLDLSKETIDKLSKLDVGQKRIALEDHLYNLLNRIKLLREILIEENPYIRELWSKAKHSKTKQYAKHKIVQRYIRDPEVQASVEMLLFDCMIILGNKTDIERLWIKASSLFSGINLRNVLGHGNPTLENIGKLLDPDDLPSVLVNEMLQLIEDEVAIQAIQDFRHETKSDFTQFHAIMNEEDNTEHLEIRKEIMSCARWKRYSMFIPLENERNIVSVNIIPSTSIDCGECER